MKTRGFRFVTGNSSGAPFLSWTRGKQLRRARVAPHRPAARRTRRRVVPVVRARGGRDYVAPSQRRAGDQRREMARARRTTRLDGSWLTSAALSTNEGARRGDVSRLAVANLERRGGPTGTRLPAVVTRFPPLAPSFFSLSLSLSPLLRLFFSLPHARAPSVAVVSLARTPALSLSVLSATSSNLYFRLDRELGANWSKRARPPRFFNRPHGKLTASGRRRRHRRCHRRRASSYIRATVCARAAPVARSRGGDDACLNLNTLWQRRGEAVPSARVTPSEPSLPSSPRRRHRRRACHAWKSIF